MASGHGSILVTRMFFTHMTSRRVEKIEMSLFVGNISKYVKSWELEDEFMRFGRCEIKRNVSNVSVSSKISTTITRSICSLSLFAISNQIFVCVCVQGSYAFVEYEVEKHAEDAM